MIVIRQATTEDAERLAFLNKTVHQLHVSAAPQMFKPTTGADPDIIAWYRQLVADENTTLYLLEANGEPVGYVGCIIRHLPETPFRYAESVLYIEQLAVTVQHQRNGYGQMLMERAYQLAREHGISRIVLDVWDFNDQALRFYRKLGFQVYVHRMHRFI